MKKFVIFSIIVLLLPNSCKKTRLKEAAAIVDKLTLEQKIGQMMIYALPGKSLARASRELIRKYKPGGFVLYGGNYWLVLCLYLAAPGIREHLADRVDARHAQHDYPKLLSEDYG